MSMLDRSTIRVLVVDDSMVFGRFLTASLPKANPRIQVVGHAISAKDTMDKLPRLKPDVMTLDVEMPVMNGIEFIKQHLPKYPIPTVLVSSLNIGVFDALQNGAVDFVRKPDASSPDATEKFVKSLAYKITAASYAKVRIAPPGLSTAGKMAAKPGSATSQMAKIAAGNRPASPGNAFSPAAADPAKKTAAQLTAALPKGRRPAPTAPPELIVTTPSSQRNCSLATASPLKMGSTIIALGASTGGTEATLEVLKYLPADIPAMVITQHMPKGFTGMYAERLNRECKMEVKEAQHGDKLRRGLVLIAPGGEHQMSVVRSPSGGYEVALIRGNKVNGHCPSVDVLFDSVATNVRGYSQVGIILTGMGRDGARGLLNMKKAGAYTIGQDQDSSVVYGMPMVAWDIGAVKTQASCGAIAGVLIDHLNKLR